MQLKLLGYSSLYHAIENTANQNSGKLLYIQQYSTEPSLCALPILFQKAAPYTSSFFQMLFWAV